MNYSRASKRRSLETINAKTAKKRNCNYKELLKLSNKTINTVRALKALDASSASLGAEVIKTHVTFYSLGEGRANAA